MKIKPKQKNRNLATNKAPLPNQIIHYPINETTPKPNHPKNRNPYIYTNQIIQKKKIDLNLKIKSIQSLTKSLHPSSAHNLENQTQNKYPNPENQTRNSNTQTQKMKPEKKKKKSNPRNSKLSWNSKGKKGRENPSAPAVEGFVVDDGNDDYGGLLFVFFFVVVFNLLAFVKVRLFGGSRFEFGFGFEFEWFRRNEFGSVLGARYSGGPSPVFI